MSPVPVGKNPSKVPFSNDIIDAKIVIMLLSLYKANASALQFAGPVPKAGGLERGRINPGTRIEPSFDRTTRLVSLSIGSDEMLGLSTLSW